MNLEELARLNQREPGKVASNALMYLAYDEEGNGYIRLRSPFFRDPEIVAAFQGLGELMERIANPRFVNLENYLPDEDGGEWSISQDGLRSLANQLRATPGMIADQEWKEKFLEDIFATVDHLHRREIIAVDLSLDSIIVSGRGDHRLYLMPPCSPFLFAKQEIWKLPKPHLAEELQTNIDVDKRVDIYALGNLIKTLYHHEGVPYIYGRAVRLAMSQRADKRPETISEMQRIMSKSAKGKIGRSILFGIAGFAIAGGLLYWATGNDEETVTQNDIQPESYNDELYEKQLRDTVESYLNDTIYLLQDTAYSLSPEKKAEQRERMQQAQEVFRMELERQAASHIHRMYGNNALEQSESNYQRIVAEESKKILELSNRLAEQYGIEPSTANRIASEVISAGADRINRGQ